VLAWSSARRRPVSRPVRPARGSPTTTTLTRSTEHRCVEWARDLPATVTSREDRGRNCPSFRKGLCTGQSAARIRGDDHPCGHRLIYASADLAIRTHYQAGRYTNDIPKDTPAGQSVFTLERSASVIPPRDCMEGLSLGLVHDRPRSAGWVHQRALLCGFAFPGLSCTRCRTATDQKVGSSSLSGRAWSEGVRALGWPCWVSMVSIFLGSLPTVANSLSAAACHNALRACAAELAYN
jgi:hypothetical protein